MDLTPEEEAELAALKAELVPQTQNISRSVAAPQRSPGDLELNIDVLTPEEEAELQALQAEFGQRPAPAPAEDKSFLTQAGETYDKYMSAPLRQAAGTLQDTGSLSQAGSAMMKQFGADPSLAPTGKEMAVKAGLSDQNTMIPRNPMAVADEQRAFRRADVPTQSEVVSPAGMAGFAVDNVLDMSNLLPFVGPAISGSGKVARGALKGSAAMSDAALGTKFVKVGGMAADTAQATAKATRESKIQLSKLFKPDVVPDFKETVGILEANNIPTDYIPEALEYGERSVVSRLARNTAEGPLGGDALEKHFQFVQNVSKATDNNIAKFSGGKIPSKQEAGRILREGYDKGVDDFFDQMDITYNSIIQQAPGIQLTPESKLLIDKKMNGILIKAKGLTKRGISKTDRSQGQELINAVYAYRNAGTSLKQQKEAMDMIGRVAFKSVKSGAELPSDIRSLRDMYFSLQKGFTESTRFYLGDDIADSLIKNNSDMSHHFTERGPIAKIIQGGSADEEVFSSLVMKGNSKEIEALRNILPAENFEALKSAFLDGLASRNADGAINFRTTRTTYLNKKDQLLNVFTLDELKPIEDLLRVGDKSGQGILSTSGTGASTMYQDLKGALQNKIGGDALLETMKKNARQRSPMSSPPKSWGGKVEVSGSKALEASEILPAQKKSGIQLLRENSPVSKGQAARGAKLESIQQRNERLDKYKKMKGKL